MTADCPTPSVDEPPPLTRFGVVVHASAVQRLGFQLVHLNDARKSLRDAEAHGLCPGFARAERLRLAARMAKLRASMRAERIRFDGLAVGADA